MENFDNDKILCNLAFEEYVLRKKILELKLKAKLVDNNTLCSIGKEIAELRERANYLNNLKMNDICEKVR